MSNNFRSISVRLLFFAKTRELSGLSEVAYQLNTPKIVASDLLKLICREFNLEVIRESLILAINENYIDDLQRELLLRQDLMFNTDMNHLILTRDALNVGEINNKVSAEACGAISLFVGTTRDCFEEKKVLSLEYEAYEPMALKQMEVICEELRRQWPEIVNIAICHRLGLVRVLEASVVIAISSPHRKTSLDAVAVAIDELKKRVPIWKKEIYEENEPAWKENNEFGVCSGEKSNIFNESIYDIEDPHPPTNQLVQISASEDEIKRRIECFVEKKRDEIDLCNIMDFTNIKQQSQVNSQANEITRQEQKEGETEIESVSCARVNTTIVKQDYSKCHLKVRRVENNIGPQLRPDYLNALDKLMVSLEGENIDQQYIIHNKEERDHCNKEESVILKHPAILERLRIIEEYINVPQSKINNIYQRLKVIEDRILYLESISPEYNHFLVDKLKNRDTSSTFEPLNDITPTAELCIHERKIYSVSDIDAIIQSSGRRDKYHHNSNI